MAADEGGPAPRKSGRAGAHPAPRPVTPGRLGPNGIELDDLVACRCETCQECPCGTGHASAVCACCRAGHHDGSCGIGRPAALEPA